MGLTGWLAVRVGQRALLGLLLAALFILTGCLSNFPDLLITPTPSPTVNPNLLINPDIDLDPVGGFAGTYVNIRGQGWLPGKLVILKLEDAVGQSGILAANIADSQGTFQTGFVYPGTERWSKPGFYTIVAYTVNEDISTSTQFVVIQPTDQPTATATRRATATPMISPSPSSRVTPTATIVRPTPVPFEFSLLPTRTPAPTVEPTATDVPTNLPTATPEEATPSTPTTLDISQSEGEEQTVLVPVIITRPIATTTINEAPVITTPVITTPVVTATTNVIPVITTTGDGPLTQAAATSTIIQLPTPLPTPLEATATPRPTPTSTPTWTPAPVVVVIQDWRGDYWANPDLAGSPLIIRNDTIIDFEWGSGSPAAEIPSDNFSARWTRSINFEAGIYTFKVDVDDGVRLFVDGQLLIDGWQDGSRRELTAQTVLNQGQHQIILEYYERTGNALIALSWEGKADFTGWRGEYFANMMLSGRPMLLRDDERIDFPWGIESPAAVLPADKFSARWQRRVFFDQGDYRFTATADDGVRMWIDGRIILDEWRDQAAETFNVDISLTEGFHDLYIEYYENTAGAIIQIDWERIVPPTLVSTPTWTPNPTPALAVTPTWTPSQFQPTPTWTPQR